jgi:hypothetical protein
MFALSVALALAFPAAASDKNEIVVSGSAEVLASPDFASIDIGVETSDPIAANALKANNEKMAQVVAAIKALAISDNDMQTSTFSISPVHPKIGNSYEDDESRTIAYKVTNKLTVHVTDMQKVADVIDAAVEAGANSSNSVEFDVKDRQPYTDKALAAAVKDAHHKAEVMAATEGVKVGCVLSMDTETSVSRGGHEGIETVVVTGYRASILPGRIAIEANVVVTYVLE